MDASIFFTFYGLNIIHKDFERLLKVSPLGNPAMPMPIPMPNVVLGLPGMGPMATQMMKAKFRGKHVAGIGELLESAQDLGVRLIACQMTMDVFGYAAGRLHRRRRVRRRRRVPRRGAPGARDPLRLGENEMSQTEIKETQVLDARGLLCPMPIVKTAKAMKELAPGDVLKLHGNRPRLDRRRPRLGDDAPATSCSTGTRRATSSSSTCEKAA